MADELYAAPASSALPGGVRVATARHDGVTVTRVEIAREGLERPRGRYVTLEVPRGSLLDERDESVIEPAAAELRALLPAAGPVLVLGVGNRRVTADALGPRTVQKIFVTMGQRSIPVQGIRPVAAVAPGVSASTGLSLQQLAAAQHIGKLGLNVAQTEQYIDRLTAENRTEPPRRRPTYVIKDVRLFLDSVERGVRLMQSAGVGAEVGRRDTEEEILLTIHIPKRREAGVVTKS